MTGCAKETNVNDDESKVITEKIEQETAQIETEAETEMESEMESEIQSEAETETEIETKEETENETVSESDICELARRYYKLVNGQEPPCVDVDVEQEINDIREKYYDVQNRLDTFEPAYIGDAEGYYDNWENYPSKVVIKSNERDWNYSREYYFSDDQLYFAFVYDGKEEHRFYFVNNELIRYIDENSNTYDYVVENETGNSMAERILEEAYATRNELFSSWD